MKKARIISLVLTAMFVMVACVGCGQEPVAQTGPSDAPGETNDATPNEPADSGEKLIVGLQVHTLSNSYNLQLKAGAEAIAADLTANGVPAEAVILTSEGDNQKEIDGIKALLAGSGDNMIFAIDPNQATNAAVVADACENAEVYWSTIWSTAEGVYPGQYPHLCSFQTPDDELSGYTIAVEMFKRFETPYKGTMLAIHGELANSAEIARFKGLQRALEEYPEVELLDDQAGDWLADKALTITETWLSKYSDVDGIWCANDNMAVGAVKALEAKDLKGKVQVCGVDAITEAIDLIKNGSMCCTMSSDGYRQAYYALAYAYAAYSGEYDPTQADPSESMFMTPAMLITAETVEEYEEMSKNAPQLDYNDFKAFIASPMELPQDY